MLFLYEFIENLLNMPEISVMFFEVDIIRFNLFKIEYSQGKARQGKRQKYSININFNHNGNIVTLFKFFVNMLYK